MKGARDGDWRWGLEMGDKEGAKDRKEMVMGLENGVWSFLTAANV